MCHLLVVNYSNWQARKQKVIFKQTYTVCYTGAWIDGYKDGQRMTGISILEALILKLIINRHICEVVLSNVNFQESFFKSNY